jgi:SPX domain protein involved in polyphosphate accumulation
MWMSSDPYRSPTSEVSYSVHTYYLDSDDFLILRKSANKDADRFKLRIRFYDHEPSSPVYLETKQTVSGRTVKRRLRISWDVADMICRGEVARAQLECPFPEFWEWVLQFNARPIVHIAYNREAFIGKVDAKERITMDRMVRFQPALGSLSAQMHDPTHIWRDQVILELKFSDSMPRYFEEITQRFGLKRSGASKYVQSFSSGLPIIA